MVETTRQDSEWMLTWIPQVTASWDSVLSCYKRMVKHLPRTILPQNDKGRIIHMNHCELTYIKAKKVRSVVVQEFFFHPPYCWFCLSGWLLEVAPHLFARSCAWGVRLQGWPFETWINKLVVRSSAPKNSAATRNQVQTDMFVWEAMLQERPFTATEWSWKHKTVSVRAMPIWKSTTRIP